MSGGRFNYAGARIRDELEAIAEDDHFRTLFPSLSADLLRLAHALYTIEHDADWFLSGDSDLQNHWETTACDMLRDALLPHHPVSLE